MTKAERAEKREAEIKAGIDPDEAHPWQYSVMESFGLVVSDSLDKRKAYGIIARLKQRAKFHDIAKEYGLDSWEQTGPSEGQIKLIDWKLGADADGVPYSRRPRCKRDAGLLIDAKLEPEKFQKERFKEIDKARRDSDLDGVARDIVLVRGLLDPDVEATIVKEGKKARQRIQGLPIEE